MALPVLFLVATGLPLQFTQLLSLGSTNVELDWLLDSYGIHAPAEAVISNRVLVAGDLLLANERELRIDQPLVGSVDIGPFSLVALQGSLLLIPFEPAVPIETVDLPYAVQGLALLSDQQLIIRTPLGLLQSADLGANWSSYFGDVAESDWIKFARIPADPAIQQKTRANKLVWERVLQDLHSGRTFGPVGEWVMSLASLALVVLALSGLFMCFRRRR